MKKILILGGGFGGVACGLELARHNLPDCEITLINDHEYHVLTPALYNVATSEEPSRDVAVPLSTIFENKPINIVIAKVDKILPQENKVQLKNGSQLSYGYLVLALGAETEDFHLPGVVENTLPLKSLYDASILRNKVKMLFENACNNKVFSYPLRVCIGGGGFTGTELAGELHKYCEKLAKQFMMPANNFEVSVIQSGDQLLNGLDKDTAVKAKQRLEQLHVKIILGSHITKVDKNLVTLENGQTIPFNLLVWTVGIRANSILANSGFKTDKGGKVAVNSFVQTLEYPNIFACGDNAYYPTDSEGHPAPAVAPIAIEQGKTIARNLIKLSSSSASPLSAFRYYHYGYIVPVSGNFALARLTFLSLDGFPAFIVLQLNLLRYLLMILNPIKALHRWNNFEMELTNPD